MYLSLYQKRLSMFFFTDFMLFVIGKLFSKLLRLGTPEYLAQIFANWYNVQSMQIKWDDNLSEHFNACNGVHQGSVLSPCFFNV